MKPGQRQTAIAVGAFALLVFLGGLGLLAWGFYAAAKWGPSASISVVLQTAWASYPWPFFIVGVLVTAIVFWLLGHFFGQNRDVYERLRKGGGVLALLLLSSPAFAQVHLAQEAAVDVGLAEVELGKAIRTSRTAAHRDLNHAAGVAMVRAARSTDTVASILRGGWYHLDATRHPLPSRDVQLADAWFHLRRATDDALLDAAAKADLVSSEAGEHLRNARARLLRVDRTLPYLPKRGTIIGNTHGDHARCQMHGHWAPHYLRDAADHYLVVYRRKAPTYKPDVFAALWEIYAIAATDQHRAQALVDGIAVTHPRSPLRLDLTDLQRPMEALRLLQNARTGDGTGLAGEPGMPEHYLTMLALWSEIVDSGPDYRRFIFRTADSWAHSAAAAWWVMECRPGSRCAR